MELAKVSCFLSTLEVHNCHLKFKVFGFWKAENSTSSALALLASLLSLPLSLKLFVWWWIPCAKLCWVQKLLFFWSLKLFFSFLFFSLPCLLHPHQVHLFLCSSQKLLKRSNKSMQYGQQQQQKLPPPPPPQHNNNQTFQGQQGGRSFFCSYHQLTHGTSIHDPWGWLNKFAYIFFPLYTHYVWLP